MDPAVPRAVALDVLDPSIFVRVSRSRGAAGICLCRQKRSMDPITVTSVQAVRNWEICSQGYAVRLGDANRGHNISIGERAELRGASERCLAVLRQRPVGQSREEYLSKEQSQARRCEHTGADGHTA